MIGIFMYCGNYLSMFCLATIAVSLTRLSNYKSALYTSWKTYVMQLHLHISTNYMFVMRRVSLHNVLSHVLNTISMVYNTFLRQIAPHKNGIIATKNWKQWRQNLVSDRLSLWKIIYADLDLWRFFEIKQRNSDVFVRSYCHVDTRIYYRSRDIWE